MDKYLTWYTVLGVGAQNRWLRFICKPFPGRRMWATDLIPHLYWICKSVFCVALLWVCCENKFCANGMTYEVWVSLPKSDSNSFMKSPSLMKDLSCSDHRTYLSRGRLRRSLLVVLINQPSTTITSAVVPSTCSFLRDSISYLGVSSAFPAFGRIDTWIVSGSEAAFLLMTSVITIKYFTQFSMKPSLLPFPVVGISTANVLP